MADSILIFLSDYHEITALQAFYAVEKFFPGKFTHTDIQGKLDFLVSSHQISCIDGITYTKF